jgi:transcriptional regulator with XRE-family HTH domain
VTADNLLGEYLRAKRERVLPADVGLRVGVRRRRVEGLRREEVALLAGISAEYYIRLEQGRERNPSTQVLAGIAIALGLDRPSEDYLRGLAGHSPAAERLRTATSDVAGFLESMTTTPAAAHDRVLEITASNALVRAIAPGFVPGLNLLRAAFTSPAFSRLYVEADELAARLVTYLRAGAAAPPPDPRLAPLVAELSAASPEFERLWALHDVRPASTGTNRMRHAVYGELTLHFERLCFAGSDDPVIVVYHADRGSETERVLARLAADIRARDQDAPSASG